MAVLSRELAETRPEAGADADPAPRLAVDSEGYVYDADSGEVVGHQGISDTFRVDSREAAEWVLDLRARLEAEVLAVDARLAAARKHLQAQRRAALRRLAWWEWRFEGPLLAWARDRLAGGRARTLTLDHGVVRARKVPAAHRVLDDAAALAFVKVWRPDLVRVTETVGVKAVLAAREAAERASGEAAELPFLVASPAGEHWAIDTGIRGEAEHGDGDGGGAAE